ncbi:MAG: response regulator [Spirochaetales bacterium]|nr:response regulator [Spirochaetales bacterium]MDD6839975.1 response regulator [Spirochaetales bacterium]
MTVVAVDDEEISLMCLEAVLDSMDDVDKVLTFSNAEDTIDYFKTGKADAAFLDIQLYLSGGTLNGLMLAAKIKELCPDCHVVFVTSCPEYAVDAFKLHVSGYIVKPVTREAARKELDYIIMEKRAASNARGFIEEKEEEPKVRVQCFGNFEVFWKNKPVVFQLSKAKELFAYLVHRKGASVSMAELAAVLFEDKEDGLSVQSQIRNLVASMRKTFSSLGCPDLFNKSRGYISIKTDLINCDYYSFMNGDSDAINEYSGEYMAQYSWAEFTVGYLEGVVNREI